MIHRLRYSTTLCCIINIRMLLFLILFEICWPLPTSCLADRTRRDEIPICFKKSNVLGRWSFVVGVSNYNGRSMNTILLSKAHLIASRSNQETALHCFINSCTSIKYNRSCLIDLCFTIILLYLIILLCIISNLTEDCC